MDIVRAADITSRATDRATFTSQVWRADVLTTDGDGLRSNRFVYAPGHRSNWHIHEGEQALIVLDGTGVVQWEGIDAAYVLRSGDWVHVTPGVPHWHGAVPTDIFSHLAVTASGATRWLDPVDDDTYRHSLPDGMGDEDRW